YGIKGVVATLAPSVLLAVLRDPRCCHLARSAKHMSIEPRKLPRHVGIIMDGNGRWAERRGLPRLDGHRIGADSVRDVTRAARELGIEALTLYAFSSQNWQRPVDEVGGLMQLLRDYLIGERAEILDN